MAMANKALPTDKSCCDQSCNAGGSEDEPIDRLSLMPDDICLLILSRFSIKEAAVIRLTSQKWKNLLAYHPNLEFRDKRSAVEKRSLSKDDRLSENHTFVKWVNYVVEEHRGQSIDEFKVIYDLDNSNQDDISKWLIFALEKQVKRIELNFSMLGHIPMTRRLGLLNDYVLPLECCMPLERHRNLAGRSPALTSLCLDSVDITDEVLENFLHACELLEYLSIVDSRSLTSMKVHGLSLPLKYLKIHSSFSFKTIDISAPKLLSFEYWGYSPKVHIKNASSLTSVAMSGYMYLSCAFDMFSKYLGQLKYLELGIPLHIQGSLPLARNQSLINLRHLKLIAGGLCCETLDRWIPLIEASPCLQKLTMQLITLRLIGVECGTVGHVRSGCPLKCLKILKIVDFVGCRIDLRLANYVVQHAINLKKVIISIYALDNDLMEQALRRHCAKELERKSCSGAKVIFRKF